MAEIIGKFVRVVMVLLVIGTSAACGDGNLSPVQRPDADGDGGPDPNGDGGPDARSFVDADTDNLILDGDVDPECFSIVENPSIFNAASCAWDDVNQAISEATTNGGGTVCLPPCVSEWWQEGISMPGGIGILGQGIGATVLRSTAYRFFQINEPGNQPGAFRITGISFEGYHPESDTTVHNIIAFNNIQDFRIDHCHLRGCAYCISAGSRREYPASTGVVDHNIIERGESTYTSLYCVSVGPKLWEEDMDLGEADAVFIEDNTLIECGHPAATFGGGHYVFRYNEVINSSSLDGHGPGFESTGRGTRAIEVYNNHFYHTFDKTRDNNGRGWTAIGLRAGGGIITNNTFEYYSYGVRFSIDTGAVGRTRGSACSGCNESDCFEVGEPCYIGDSDCYQYNAGAFECSGCGDNCFQLIEPYEYPSLDQIHDIWVWNNTYNDVSNNDEIMLYSNDSENMILEDRDYFRRAPNDSDDGFVYTPYTYPHPLITN